MTLTLRVVPGAAPDRSLEVTMSQVVLGGYTGRDAGARDRHIDELRAIGIEPPASVPAFWRVARHLLTTEDGIEVQGEQTSGEAEFALVGAAGRTWVTIASDQTDRELERVSIPRSKQLCPKVLGTDVVALDEVRQEWDQIELTSDVSADGAKWIPYQRATLADLLDVDTLLAASGLGNPLPDGTVLLSGTVALVDGQTRFLPHFRAALTVPGGHVALRLAYRVHVLPEIVVGAPEPAA
jgi:hypothetical protein